MRRTWLGVAAVVLVSLLVWWRLAAGDSSSVAGDAPDPRRQAATGSTGREEAIPAEPAQGPRQRTGRRDDALPPETVRALDAWERTCLVAIRRHLETLAEQGDGHAQLVLALMFFNPASGLSDPAALERRYDAEVARRADALERARQMLPNDPLVAWHTALGCFPDREGCDYPARLLRLRELDPDNAAVWMLGLDALIGSGDTETLDLQLRLIADAGRYDSLLDATGRLLADKLADLELPELEAGLRDAMSRRHGLGRPVTDEELRYLPIMGVWAAQTTPGAGLFQACVGPAATGAPALCRRIGARLGAGSSLIERAMGLSMQVQLTADHPDGPRWREALRRHYWQYERLVASAREAPPPGYLHRMLAEGEIAALEWRLARAGMSEPPAGWLPSNPRHRALVTTGRPPPGD